MYQTSYYRSPFGETTYTKVFVGGLAWETPTEEMRRYFDQFGEILEAVILTDKNTGKSKGYGFEADSATIAVADPNPLIDGRKANCNIASFGRPRPSPPRGQTRSPSQYQSEGPSAYTRMAAPLPPAAAAHQLMYPSYGYTYNPDQYHPALYNIQLQQAQYYYQQQQQLYGGGATSPSAATIMPSPYYYDYSLQTPRVPYQHHHPHLPQPHNPQQQQHQRFTSPSFLVYPSSSSFSPPLQGLLSSSEGAYLPSFYYFYLLSILHLK
ncbi:RNA-binding (RRM/RBD/RNP motifs) family protein [Raphanus sativus]|nr:RNA-binding (RRM/RBD/RNP motifs) family protein [Raphanus sativus]